MSLDIWLVAFVDLGGPNPFEVQIDDRNYTHNATPIWHEAGVYEALYESEGKQARDVIPVLERGVADMKARPDVYVAMNPPNGWGCYETALLWIEEFLEKCKSAPLAVIGVSR